MKFIRKLFCFRQPLLEEFDYLPLVAAQKVLLLFAWKFNGPYSVQVKGQKRKYYLYQGSLIVKLPANTTTIHVIVSSFWRKNAYTLNLQPILLDSESSSILISQFNPLLMQEIDQLDIALYIPPLKIRTILSKVKIATLNLSYPPFQINQQAIQYKP